MGVGSDQEAPVELRPRTSEERVDHGGCGGWNCWLKWGYRPNFTGGAQFVSALCSWPRRLLESTSGSDHTSNAQAFCCPPVGHLSVHDVICVVHVLTAFTALKSYIIAAARRRSSCGLGMSWDFLRVSCKSAITSLE